LDTQISIETAKHVLLSFSVILGAGTVAGFLAQKLKVPDIVIFLVAGILLGPGVSGLLNIGAGSTLNQIVLIFGACYILFDGGASLRFKVLKEVWITIVLISTAGVLIMTVVTGIAAFYILKVPFMVALLLGAAIASTDPATLVPIFRQIKVKARVAQTVVSESAFNDAMGAIVTFGVLAAAKGSTGFSLGTSFMGFISQTVIGIVTGGVLGYLAALLIAHEKYDFLAEYAPVVTLMAVISAYLSAEGMQASGFMAVFVFGMVIGNKQSFGFRMERGEARKMDEFIATTALIMRLFIFILLGSQVDFSLISQYSARGMLVVLIFMLIARPLTVFACALPDRRARWNFNELLFMCWTRETGVIPAALAGLLVGMNAPGARIISSVTLIAILMTILIQGTTTKWLARRLGLLEE
jgi:cell volume regulation protein A